MIGKLFSCPVILIWPVFDSTAGKLQITGRNFSSPLFTKIAGRIPLCPVLWQCSCFPKLCDLIQYKYMGLYIGAVDQPVIICPLLQHLL